MVRKKMVAATAATLLMAFVLAGCQHDSPVSSPYTLETAGSMHATIMEGDRSAKKALIDFQGTENIYAVGPIEDLRGEITIVKSRPMLATVTPEGVLEIEESFGAGASFLVWSEVEAWKEEALPANVRTLDALETYLTQRASDEGLQDAFPFLVTGMAENIRFHVLNAQAGATVEPGMASHKQTQAHFEAGPAPVTLVGFYSTVHQGVFVHKGALSHIHFISDDESQSGHVETFKFADGEVVLSLPH